MAPLFQPYNRLGRENSAIEGTGIGLVISRRLAELMGGTLAAAATPAQARPSRCACRRPRPTPRAPTSTRCTRPSPAPTGTRLVHYVEDNETNVEVMRGVLALRAQVVLESRSLGLDGLAAIRRRRPDLILLDMHLPDIGGLELLRHLKDDDGSGRHPGDRGLGRRHADAHVEAGADAGRGALRDQAGGRVALPGLHRQLLEEPTPAGECE